MICCIDIFPNMVMLVRVHKTMNNVCVLTFNEIHIQPTHMIYQSVGFVY